MLSTCYLGGANAATVDYTFQGTGDYVLNGSETTGDFSFSFVGDTINVALSGGEYTNVIGRRRNSTFAGAEAER